MYLILVSILLMFFYNDCLSSIIEGQQYIRLNQSISNAPELLEFFSFYCSHCYQFEQVYKISDSIRKKLSKDIVFYKYHVNALGDLGKQLTHAWAVAIVLGVEDQIEPVLFMAVQEKQSIHTIEDIRTIFIQFGINANEYDTAWNSILVKNLVLNQEQAAIKFQIKGVPSIFVQGKYMIKNEKLDTSSVNTYIQQFFELLNLLIEKT